MGSVSYHFREYKFEFVYSSFYFFGFGFLIFFFYSSIEKEGEKRKDINFKHMLVSNYVIQE